MPCSLPERYGMDTWSTMMDTAVHSYIIYQKPLDEITMDDQSEFFLLTNTLNNILQSVNNATEAILQESKNISEYVVFSLQLLLIVVSGSLAISFVIIFPVATQVDQNKDELLKHFMLIDRDDVKKQLDKCRFFLTNMHDKDINSWQQNGQGMEEMDIEGN